MQCWSHPCLPLLQEQPLSPSPLGSLISAPVLVGSIAEKERGAGSSSGRTPGEKRAPPDPRETLVQSQSQGAAGEVQQPSTSGVADEFWVLARGAENYKALRQMAEVLEKHRGGDLEEWERKQEEGKKRRRV